MKPEEILHMDDDVLEEIDEKMAVQADGTSHTHSAKWNVLR